VAAVVVVLILVAALGGGQSWTVYAPFTNAIQMTPGQQVRIAGRPVGEIASIKLVNANEALVALRISNGNVWPLPQGTYAAARWGSTTAYLGRYTELIPGPKGNPPLHNGAILPAQPDQSAFELDQVYNLFSGGTASQTGALVDNFGATLRGQGPALKAGLSAAPSGLGQTADLMQELSANTYDLQTLATAGNRTVTALAQRSTQLGDLVTHAAGTFGAFAAHTAAEQQALQLAAPAFAQTDTTFGRLDTSLGDLTTLVNDLRPGAPALARLAGTARAALTTLRTVAPLATSTLNVGISSAPTVTKFLKTATTVMPSAGKALGTFAPMAACLRPYTPDIVGFFSTWGGAAKNYADKGHYARAFPLTVMPGLYAGTILDPQAALAADPGLSYAFPRPPGLNQGHPYFDPQCGVNPSSLVAPNNAKAGGE
jgi:phospholipid/cholesterol/gamma-HCH transport system substrate-binding protein